MPEAKIILLPFDAFKIQAVNWKKVQFEGAVLFQTEHNLFLHTNFENRMYIDTFESHRSALNGNKKLHVMLDFLSSNSTS